MARSALLVLLITLASAFLTDVGVSAESSESGAVAASAVAVGGASVTPSPPLPEPLQRANATILGLMQYFFQTERNGKPANRTENCPCFSCDGRNCSIQMCSWCSPTTTGCPTKTSPGCYTTASAACMCNDPPGPAPPGSNTAAEFFFSCGQLGGLAPFGKTGSSGRCQCESDWVFACTNCYRWWSAVGLEATVNYCITMSEKANSTGTCGLVTRAADSMWEHSPYNSQWDGGEFPVYVDDFTWYALAYLRVYDWTGNQDWRQRSIGLHHWAWKYGWDHRARATNTSRECGGFWWNLNWNMKFKDTITIVEMLHVDAKLAATSETAEERSSFLGSAMAIWDWMFEFDNGNGLVAPNGVISTSVVPEVCCSAASAALANETNATAPGVQCSNSRVPGMSYNHGLMMSSAALLYNTTGDKMFLDKSLDYLDAAFENLTDSDGALIDAQRGARMANAYCQGYSDPGADFFSFKGIFAMHLGYYAQMLKDMNALSADAHSKILSILAKSSDNAWRNSAVHPPFTGVADLCNIATEDDQQGPHWNPDDYHWKPDIPEIVEKKHHPKNFTYPKFHWWWTTSNGSLETPADPRMWFTRTNIQCTYPLHNNSNASDPILWVGNVSAEAQCKALCARNSSCTKYTYGQNEVVAAVRRDNATSPCPCFSCQNVRCYSPECVWCGAKTNPKSCPKPTSQGCYTTAAKGCSCAVAPPTPTPADPGNCWLFRLAVHGNRSSMAACTTLSIDTGLAVSVKRPPPPTPPDFSASCRGRCGDTSDVMQRMKAAGVDTSNITCLCDAACSRHLDCCIDYVQECLPPDKQVPTCRGHCSSEVDAMSTEENVISANGSVVIRDNIGIPIPGGGYCYCYGSCYNLYTDNNSYGSCCGDYAFECLKTARDAVCMDSRTQTSALQVFVAHHTALALNVTDGL
eukprot:scpid28281/ scgid8652/ 